MSNQNPTTRDPVGSPNFLTHSYAIEFNARGSEYFRIWIVNLLLTLVTLGIQHVIAFYAGELAWRERDNRLLIDLQKGLLKANAT